MAQGTVKWFNPDGYRSLQENQRVGYTAARGPKGPQAEQVQPL
jgi:CspA family cold shock protein